ncbi:MAG: molybdopterin-dependent oxidoreductase [Gemmataceae bacterium]
MATVTVNGKSVDIGSDRLNCVQAAERAGVLVPSYCWHPGLTVVASCRMCLVEYGEPDKSGKVQMLPRVVPGCQTPVKDGAVIVTDSPKAKAAQAQTLEGLLLNHPLDCPVCDKAGECKLQDFSYEFGNAKSRMIDPKNTPPNKPDISSKIALFTDRCIMCTRCVRFTREVAGTAELTVVSRGTHSEIDIFPGEPLDNKLSGNVVDLCPVGALASKDFLYKQRVWFLQDTDSVCAGCSTGCSIHVDANKSVLFRLRPRENMQAQGYWMCDEGRWGAHYVKDNSRFKRPMELDGGSLRPVAWSVLLPELKKRFADAATKKASGVAAVLSPFLTCEEAFLLATFFKGLSKDVRLVLGPVPVVGGDDTYPKDRRGKPVEPVKFTIRAEKCPNRKGVEAVLRQFQGEVRPFSQLTEACDKGLVQAVWVAASYPQGGGYPVAGPWLSEEQAASIRKATLVVVQDLFATPLSKSADYVLPSAAWAEKEGTFVNHAGLAQPIKRAIHAPGESRSEGQVYADLLGRKGLLHAGPVRAELAKAVPYFKARWSSRCRGAGRGWS